MELADALHWPGLVEICQLRVRPTRARKAPDVAASPWWQYWRPRGELYSAIEGLPRVIVISRLSQTAAFAFLPSELVYSERLDVFALSTDASFALLQCRVHESWARLLGSSMKDDLLYTPSDCFETFPFPPGWETNGDLDRVGREYYEFRAALMVRNNEGLTKTYNRFHDPEERDPDILHLRELHAAMDRAVLDAYGWRDIQPRCKFILDYENDEEEEPGRPSRRRKPWRYRWPDDIRDEVLGRLLALNEQRAREEALAGEAAKAREKAAAKMKKPRRPKTGPAPTPLLDQ